MLLIFLSKDLLVIYLVLKIFYWVFNILGIVLYYRDWKEEDDIVFVFKGIVLVVEINK